MTAGRVCQGCVSTAEGGTALTYMERCHFYAKLPVIMPHMKQASSRETAVFFIKYLRTLGFDVTNDIFADNAWYFRNALVRANYNDLKNGIHETTEYLELFLRNLLLSEDHPLHYRTLHISGTFKDTEKPDIETQKPDIASFKADIEADFGSKTADHILRLREAFPGQTIFGRSDVMQEIGIGPSRASELLKEMAQRGIIEPVVGYGKGKYRFTCRISG